MKSEKEIKEKIKNYKTSMKDYKKQRDWISCARIQERLLILEKLSEKSQLVMSPENQIKEIKNLIKNEVACLNYFKADKLEQSLHMLEWLVEK